MGRKITRIKNRQEILTLEQANRAFFQRMRRMDEESRDRAGEDNGSSGQRGENRT